MEVDELRVAKVAKELHASILSALERISTTNSATDDDFQRLLNDVHQFQPCPQLIHSQLNSHVSIILEAYRSQPDTTPRITEFFYNLAKIVGAKKLLNYFPTDVHLIPELTRRFQSKDLHWHEKYLLLCWLTVLVLAPFRLESFQEDVKTELYQIGVSQLDGSGPLQPLGARLLGSLIMRGDCDDLYDGFFQDVFKKFEGSSTVLKQGYLFTVNVGLHKDQTLTTSGITRQLVDLLTRQDTNVDLIAKILAKLSVNLTQQDDDEGLEGLFTWFEDHFSDKNTDTRFTLARQYSKLITRIDQCYAIDIILDLVETTSTILQEPFEMINSDKLHTYLLTIAELLRLKLINDHEFTAITQIISKTFFFQQARITHISGSNIRDASNFIAWSLAKYQRDLSPQIALEVFKNLLLVCCFDKEIIIRRSGTAALQELVGRHGMTTWTHFFPNSEMNSARSIRIIEVLDYVDLGSLEKSYLLIPEKVLAIFPELKQHFVQFLCSNVYNLDNELCKLSSKSLRHLIENASPEERNATITNLINTQTRKPFNTFIALSECLPLSTDPQHITETLPRFNAVKINHHRDPPFVILGYLSLLKVLLELQAPIAETTLENIFDAIRVDGDEISQMLRGIVPNLELSQEYWAKWLYYMKNNNLNTAASVAFLKQFKEKVDDVVELLNAHGTDANVKAATLGSISTYLGEGGSLDDEVLRELVKQLDDYTVSEQGDVGSKVRLATIKLIDSNMGLFRGELRMFAELKFLRLSVEPIDRLRQKSVELLQRFYETNEISTETRDLKAYFEQILMFFQAHYDTKEAALELWRGYIFSAGALKATDTLITSSLHAFTAFYNSQTPDVQKETLLQLASLIKPEPELKDNQRHTKQILVGMQFLARALQTNIPIPDSFNLKGLYIRIHNLHLGTKNMTRLQCAIKIFGHLYVVYDLPEAKKRLIWLMTNHTLARVRVLASEELFLCYTERLQSDVKYADALKCIEEVDWNEGKNIKKYAQVLDV